MRSRTLQRPSALALVPTLLAGLALASLAACGGEEQAAAKQVDPALEARMQAFMDALVPPPADASRERLKDFRRARQRVLDDYGNEGEEFGAVARAIFEQNPEAVLTVRKGLLQVAAANLGAEYEEPLVQLLDTYEEDIGVRTTACDLLGRFYPARAVVFLEPILLDSNPNKTWPERDLMLSAWDRAARSENVPRAPVLVRLATDIYQQDNLRHLAVQLLGSVDDVRAVRALEQVLVESTGNSYLRRKAAQALIEQPDREGACATFERVMGLEADANFQLFMADVLERNCQ